MKQCLYCKKEITKPKNYSCSQWESKKYCSRNCSGKMQGFQKGHDRGKRFKKGSIPWNKGKKTELIPWNRGAKLTYLSKENSHRWKGGKIIRGGYVLVRLPEHPHAIMGGYVAEHRLVMEKYLGRYLDSQEVIHHINGNRADNRIENLKLYKNSGQHAIAEHVGRGLDGRFNVIQV